MKKKAILRLAVSLLIMMTALFAVPPAFAQQQVSGTVTVQIDAADEPGGSGLASVQLFVDGNLVSETTSSGQIQYSWDTTALPDGPHTLSAAATDVAGNQGQASLDVTVNNVVPDTTPPTISIQIVPSS